MVASRRRAAACRPRRSRATPRIPALLPGERITGEVIDYLRELRDAGARLHGASDPGFHRINVLREG